MDVGALGCFLDLLLRHLSVVVSVLDVLCDGAVKQDGLLGHQAQLRTQPGQIQALDVSTVSKLK